MVEKIKNFIKKYGLIIIAILYILSPLDLLPDFLLPVLGYLDDLGIGGVALIKAISDHRKRETQSKQQGSDSTVEGE